MSISSLGVGSGLDAETIVQKLVAVQRQPIDALQSAKSDLNSQVSSFGQVQSYLSSLQGSARALTDLSTWRASTVSSGDSTAVQATVESGTPAGAYSITVSQLAKAQSVASSTYYPASSAMVGEGTMTITLGQWSTDHSSFTQKSGSTPVSVTIGPEDNTLQKIAEKINGASAGVLASVVHDTNGYRLSIRSKETGLENGFKITTTNAQDGDGVDIGNLGALGYDPSTGAGAMELKQDGQNAKAKINNLDVESASNTMSNVVDGLSLTLTKTFATAVDVTVSSDTDSIKKAITDFASNYNSLVGYLRKQTAYNADTKKAGNLQGDRTAINLMYQLRTLAAGNGGSSSVFARLTDIGLEPQKDGTLKVDNTKLGKAVGKLDELKKMLSNDANGGPADGVGRKFKNYIDGMLGDDGPLDTKTEGLNARIKANQDQQDRLSDRAAAYEKRLRAQYQALDAQMAQLSGLSGYVSQQMKLLGG
jgi:flagellar hook-associated protein 2